MKKCKECGREEIGYGSLLDEDGYCFTCKHSKEKIKRLQEQLNEANEVIKKFEKTEIGHKQKDGTYMLTVCGVIIDPEKRPTSALVQEETYFYDPRPLTKYLEKWGVK